MDIDEKEKLTRLGDTSPEAVHARMVAARIATGMLQKEIAAAANIGITTFNSQEMRGAPSIKAMRYYYRQHRIDFNFILHGDFAQLPLDVQERLLSALSQK